MVATEPDDLFVGPPQNRDYYELGPLVDEGGQGRLYVAWVLAGDTSIKVVIKRLHAEHADDLEPRYEEWRIQLEALRSLPADNGRVEVRDVFVGEAPHRRGDSPSEVRDLYVVMNWIDGQSLETWLHEHTTDPMADRLRRLVQPAAVLDSLAAGIGENNHPFVHGDVTPNNIIEAGEKRGSVLVDFGIARFAGTAVGPFARMGSKGYRAPEVERDALWTPAADRYALAGCAYYLLTGGHPPANNDLNQMRAHLAAQSDLVRFPDLVNQVLSWRTPDPALRTGASCSEWLRGLRGTSSSLAGPVYPQPDPRTLVGPKRRTKTVVALGIVVAILAASTVAYALRRPNHNAAGATAQTTTSAAETTRVPDTTTTVADTTTVPDSTTIPDTTTVPDTTTADTTATEPVVGQGRLLMASDAVGGVGINDETTGVNGKTGQNTLVSLLDNCCGPGPINDYADFNLSRMYSTVTGRVGVTDNSPAGAPVTIQFFADGKSIYDRTFVLGQSQDVSLSVKNALRLRVQFTSPRNDVQGGAVDLTAH
jgi:serine/threonine protein kinase